MKKVYKNLSVEQLKRGVIFASTLSKFTTEQEDDTVHEVTEEMADKHARMERLKNDSFFNDSPFKFNIIRTKA